MKVLGFVFLLLAFNNVGAYGGVTVCNESETRDMYSATVVFNPQAVFFNMTAWAGEGYDKIGHGTCEEVWESMSGGTIIYLRLISEGRFISGIRQPALSAIAAENIATFCVDPNDDFKWFTKGLYGLRSFRDCPIGQGAARFSYKLSPQSDGHEFRLSVNPDLAIRGAYPDKFELQLPPPPSNNPLRRQRLTGILDLQFFITRPAEAKAKLTRDGPEGAGDLAFECLYNLPGEDARKSRYIFWAKRLDRDLLNRFHNPQLSEVLAALGVKPITECPPNEQAARKQELLNRIDWDKFR